jgi:carboxyl-terminal processing protease
MSPRGRLVVALVSTLLVAYVAVGSLLGRVFGDTTYGQLAVFNEVVRLVLDAYVEPVNIDRAMMGARMGLTDALDGDSAYLDADELRAYQQPAKEGEAEIGVVLTAGSRSSWSRPPARALPPPRPASKPGDIIKTIDGRHSRSLSPPSGQRLLRGEPGSIVKLTLLRAGSDPIDLSVVRERLVAVAPERRMLADATGYIKVAEFTPRAAEEVKSEIDALRRAGAHALVLDLRGSGAGAPADGVKIAELFLKGGPVGKLTGTREDEQVFTADPARSAWDRPLAVLVDTGTGGAAEVVTSALLDAGRGPIVGEHTFGRAGVQKIRAPGRRRAPPHRRQIRLPQGDGDPRQGNRADGRGGRPGPRRGRGRPGGRPDPRQGARSPEEPAGGEEGGLAAAYFTSNGASFV